ncbi:L-rhamnose mutarotase [Pseudonocardia acaciae]|uniref:L-rhamnose mutarotase n=1 Tax=Pseudonocardia acaciae TaxID=551276 RepID=UPI0007E8C314|nr:L-rhamnose mutarotase [Pseudonocardia acaciae]
MTASTRRHLVRRYCFTFTIIPGREAEYDRRHREVWPELVAALRANGVSNYSIFRRDRLVIGYAECEPDGPTAFGAVGDTEVNRRWAEWFGDVLVELADGTGGPAACAEVWHLP